MKVRSSLESYAAVGLYRAGGWSWASVRPLCAISVVETEIISQAMIDSGLCDPMDLCAGRFGYEVPRQPFQRMAICRMTLCFQKDIEAHIANLAARGIADVLYIANRSGTSSRAIPWDYINALDFFCGEDSAKALILDHLGGFFRNPAVIENFYDYARDFFRSKVAAIPTTQAEAMIGSMNHQVARTLIAARVLTQGHLNDLSPVQRDTMFSVDLGL